LPGLVWAVVIFVIISLPPENIPRARLLFLSHIDKAIHFLIFAVLGALLLTGVYKYRKAGGLKTVHLFWVIAAGSVYGALTEGYQYLFLPARHGNIPDAVANIFGTVFGVIIVAMVIKNRESKQKKES